MLEKGVSERLDMSVCVCVCVLWRVGRQQPGHADRHRS